VPEGSNLEIAHALSAKGEAEIARSKARWEELVEIIEALLLAFVAIATAWSGYQAARWDGVQAERYGTSATVRFKADELITLGGQQRLLDVSTFNTWIQAVEQGEEELADIYVDRFSPEYRVAFDAWLKTHPFTNPDAPPGPMFMPQYHNAQSENAAELNAQATEIFDEGTEARETADRYIRQTVLFAMALFLVAIAQRFRYKGVRIAAVGLAGGVAVFALIGTIGLPRI
jgi:hypothetical protein